MATNNALSNFMEHKFLDQFVRPSAGTIYVAVPFTGSITGSATGTDAHNIEDGLKTDAGKFVHVINNASSLGATSGVVKSLSAYPYGTSGSPVNNILTSGSVVAGCFRIVPIFFSFQEGSTNTIQNTYQLDFGVLGDGDGAGAGVTLTGYYVYEGVITKASDSSTVDINDIVDETIRTRITDCSTTDYAISVDLNKPAFYGTLSKVQAINTGIDILIKKNDIKFSMD